jgi:hypothetical protein
MEFQWREPALDALNGIVSGPAANTVLAKQFAADCHKAFVPSKGNLSIGQSAIPYRSH